jgi:hypothetical protein
MIDILKYGRVLRAYKAQGKLQLNTNESFHCLFQAAQFSDGAVRVYCHIPVNDVESSILTWGLMSNIEVRNISGITEDNREIISNGQILWTNIENQNDGNSRSIDISLIVAKMLVKTKDAVFPLQTLKFGVTNFEFEGNIVRELRTETSHKFDRGILAISLPIGEIKIEKIPDYETNLANLKAMLTTEPTCEMSLELSTHDLQWAEAIVDDLCTILSLAKGTKIVWIYLDGYDSGGIERLTIHKNAVTRPYSGASASVIDSKITGDIKEFIEVGYEHFLQLKEQYRLDKIVNAFLESKRSNSYLESRGIAAIQAIELLAGKYAEKHSLVYIMDENDFNEKVNNNGTSINDVFQKAFGESYVSALCGEHNEKIKGLNRRSLRQVLKQIFQDFTMIVPGSKLQALMETRNALVHRGSFNTDERVKEYYRLLSIMDRLLLKMLNYSGYILDCEHEWARIKIT